MRAYYANLFSQNNFVIFIRHLFAGPMYGLRLLLNVNQSDYMPTTEAAGVRLVVHEQVTKKSTKGWSVKYYYF